MAREQKLLSVVVTEEPSRSETEEVVLITPTLAAEWLANHGRKTNRKLNKARVEGYVELMAAGRWICSGEFALSFDEEGIMANGHHRLGAVIAFGSPVAFVVRRNVTREALRYTDAHQRRTARQVGRMFGIDTTWDPALRAIFQARNCGMKVNAHEMAVERLRTEFAEAMIVATPSLGIRIAGRVMNAGTRAGMLLCARRMPTEAALFIADIAVVADRSATGSKAARNFVRWIELHRGRSAGHFQQTDSMCAAVNAFVQYMSGAELEAVRGSGLGDAKSVVTKYLAEVKPSCPQP